jgi:hypothetical protein
MLRANNAYSPAIADSQTTLHVDQTTSSAASLGYRARKMETVLEIASSRRQRGYEHAEPRMIRDHSHTDPEHVWGDEGPVNEGGRTS